MKVTFHKLWGFYYLLFMTLLKNFIADRDEAENLCCDLQAALQTHTILKWKSMLVLRNKP